MNGKLKILLVVVVIALGFVLAYYTGFIDFISDIKGLQAFFKDLGFLGYIIYIGLFVIVALLMLPATPITLVSGVTFGPILGGILSLISSTIGACAAFIVAKYFARSTLEEKFKDNAIFKKIEKGVADNGTSFLILTRLVPAFPYNIQNYAYGLTSMKLSTFGLVSFITMAPGSFIYAYMAGELVTNGFSLELLLQFGAAGVVLFLISLIPKYIAKKRGIKLD